MTLDDLYRLRRQATLGGDSGLLHLIDEAIDARIMYIGADLRLLGAATANMRAAQAALEERIGAMA